MIRGRWSLHQTKVGEVHNRTVINHRDVGGLEIKHRFIFLVANHHVERDFIDRGDNRGRCRCLRGRNLSSRGWSSSGLSSGGCGSSGLGSSGLRNGGVGWGCLSVGARDRGGGGQQKK